jgi:hypothetical protein
MTSKRCRITPLTPEELHQIGEDLTTIAGEIGDLLEEEYGHACWARREALRARLRIKRLAVKLGVEINDDRPRPKMFARGHSSGALYEFFIRCVLDAIDARVRCPVLDAALGVEQTLHNLRVAVEDDRFDQAWAWERRMRRGAA